MKSVSYPTSEKCAKATILYAVFLIDGLLCACDHCTGVDFCNVSEEGRCYTRVFKFNNTITRQYRCLDTAEAANFYCDTVKIDVVIECCDTDFCNVDLLLNLTLPVSDPNTSVSPSHTAVSTFISPSPLPSLVPAVKSKIMDETNFTSLSSSLIQVRVMCTILISQREECHSVKLTVAINWKGSQKMGRSLNANKVVWMTVRLKTETEPLEIVVIHICATHSHGKLPFYLRFLLLPQLKLPFYFRLLHQLLPQLKEQVKNSDCWVGWEVSRVLIFGLPIVSQNIHSIPTMEFLFTNHSHYIL